MAIFNHETQFYSHAAPPFEPDQPLMSRFLDFVYDHVFVATIPLSILTYWLMSRIPSSNLHSGHIGLITVAASITTIYLGLIGTPAIVAALIATPALVAWKRQRHRLFKRVFQTVFVPLFVGIALIGSFLAKLK